MNKYKTAQKCWKSTLSHNDWEIGLKSRKLLKHKTVSLPVSRHLSNVRGVYLGHSKTKQETSMDWLPVWKHIPSRIGGSLESTCEDSKAHLLSPRFTWCSSVHFSVAEFNNILFHVYLCFW